MCVPHFINVIIRYGTMGYNTCLYFKILWKCNLILFKLAEVNGSPSSRILLLSLLLLFTHLRVSFMYKLVSLHMRFSVVIELFGKCVMKTSIELDALIDAFEWQEV